MTKDEIKFIINCLDRSKLMAATKKEDDLANHLIKKLKRKVASIEIEVAEFVGSFGDALDGKDKDIIFKHILLWEESKPNL